MSLILLMGNVGTGKTTYRNNNFNSGEIIICPDEWHNLNIQQKQDRLFKDLKKHLNEGKTVILDGNNISKKARVTGLHFARLAKAHVKVVDFGPGNESSLSRRLKDPGRFSVEQWKKIHIDNQHEYEKPELEEGINEIIQMY